VVKTRGYRWHLDISILALLFFNCCELVKDMAAIIESLTLNGSLEEASWIKIRKHRTSLKKIYLCKRQTITSIEMRLL